MKLMRLGAIGHERPVALVDGTAFDISELIEDVTPTALGQASLARLKSSLEEGRQSLPVVDMTAQRVGPPITGIGKIVCVGLNYRAHASEAGIPVPSEPILFLKAADTVVGPTDDVRIPPGSVKTDYEVELAVVMGREARYLSDSDPALDYVAGFAVSNDVSERAFQFERNGQWDMGKNSETFQPLGPWLVTADEVADPQSLELRCAINGETRQASTTADMIFSVAELIRYVSQFMVLYPGDVINTGTPQGVGSGFTPARFLRHGDVADVSIEGLGAQRTRFVDAVRNGRG